MTCRRGVDRCHFMCFEGKRSIVFTQAITASTDNLVTVTVRVHVRLVLLDSDAASSIIEWNGTLFGGIDCIGQENG